jgi:hypothetical protein
LAHCYGGLNAARDGVDAASETQQIETLVGFADAVLRVDSGDVGVALLDCLGCCSSVFLFFAFLVFGEGGAGRGGRTFLSLSFSVFSSFPAFAACLLSCFAVNYFAIPSDQYLSLSSPSHLFPPSHGRNKPSN